MDTNQYTNPSKLEKYSFLWSEARLLIAAIALFIGGVPPLQAFVPLPSGLNSTILTLSWIISGVASAYLLYRWMEKKMLFGANDYKDKIAFFISIISGLNLGITGLIGRNIGMSISSNSAIFVIVGLLYLGSTAYLYKRWKSSNERLF